jgi:murein DD-endopeptidase MepM/ murein hydrolase activator NlpD
VPLRRHTLAALVALSALGASTAALAASGDGTITTARAAKARASAFAREDPDGTRHGAVTANGNDSAGAAGTFVRSSTANRKGSAAASARQRKVSLFGGLVTASSASAQASAASGSSNQSGTVSNLNVNGKSRGTVTSRHTYRMGSYGTLVVLDSSGSSVTALRATLSKAYGGYPAGSTARVAYAQASASDGSAPPAPKPKPQPAPKPGKPSTTPSTPKPSQPKSKQSKKHKHRKPDPYKSRLMGPGYVFPVYGKHNFTDTFGAARADTGFHEGNDLFGAAGTPIVAVCDGSLNRVGTLPISGNRLWVKCTKKSDSFFYAHLSSFAAGAKSGVPVKKGQVIGFLGSTGDAEQTPPHLHFEIHPRDGKAVDPYAILRGWDGRPDDRAAAWVKANGQTGEEQPGTLVVVRDYLDR